MTTTPHQLRNGSLLQNWSNTGDLLTADNWSGIASIVGYRGDALTAAPGTDPQTIVADGSATPVSLVNSSTPAGTAGGVHEIPNDVVAFQGSGTADAPHMVIYLDTTGTQNVHFTATLRELDSTTIDQKFAVQYRVGGTGNYTNLPAGAVSGVFNAAGNQTVALDVTLPAAADDKSLVEIRIITNDAVGADAMVGIDDINISAAPLTNEPVVPTLSIDDVTKNEADSGTVTYTFTVSLSAPAPTGGVTFDIATADGTATAGQDYDGRTLTSQTIAAGQTSYTFDVTVNGDTDVEPNETFAVNVTSIAGATPGDVTGTGTITNTDNPPVPSASIADPAAVTEADDLVFTVTLSFAPTSTVTIDYAAAGVTATQGSDFTATSGTLTFLAGQTTKTITVPVTDDMTSEMRETLTVTLSNPSGAILSDASATGTIRDDDVLYHDLSAGNFSQDWSDTNLITANDDWSGVPSIIGYLGDGVTDVTSADPQTLTGDAANVDVIANQNSAGSASGGVAEMQFGDATIALQGSGTADAPYIVLHLDTSGREGVTVSYRLRDLDGSTDNAAQQVALQYRAGTTGAWTNVPSAYVADATAGPSLLGPDILVSAVLPTEAENVANLQVRIITANAANNDEWVGVDDIAVTSQLGEASLRIGDASGNEGASISFTVTRIGDSAGAVSATYRVTSSGERPVSQQDFDSALTGTVEFADDETTRTITIATAEDAAPEADETFTVTLSEAQGGTISDATGTGTILNDDGLPPYVTVADVAQAEGDAGTSIFTFTVTRTGGTGAFNVDFETAAGSATEGVDYQGTSGTLEFFEGEMSKTVSVTVNGDDIAELSETFQLLLSDPTGFAIVTDGAATGTIQSDDPLLISQIQGSSYYSPLLASEGFSAFNVASKLAVTVQAVVTALDNNGTGQGFYLSEEVSDWDGVDATSEGIYVSVGPDLAAAFPNVKVGDLVTLSAQVMESQVSANMPRTILVNPTGLSIDLSNQELPVLLLDAGRPIPNSVFTNVTPVYTDSADDGDDSFDAATYGLSFWESVEGMLVKVPDMVLADGVVGTSGGDPFVQAYSTVHADADQINDRGGYTIGGDTPTVEGGRHLHDGDVNPDVIEVDFSGFATGVAPANLATLGTMGDVLGDVTGIVDFDFTDRKLFVTDYNPSEFVNTMPAQDVTVLGDDSRSLTVATFNVENLDPLDGLAKFTALAQNIAVNMNAPDIISIEEMQDNNGPGAGTTDASQGWDMLVSELNKATGSNYQWVDQAPTDGSEGGEPGGNIRVGFLYNTDRVQLGDLSATATIEERRTYTDRIGDGVRDIGDKIAFSDDMIAGEIKAADWSGTRLSLLGEFVFNGNTVYVTANHWPSKSGGSGSFWQYNQNLETGDPDNGAWARRNEVAEDVYAMMNVIESADTGAGVVAAGDFNDFYFYRPLQIVTGEVDGDGVVRTDGARFDNLTLTLPEGERYTYTFDGRSQAIDHVIVNDLLSGIATYDIVHLNSGYNEKDANSPALSDHDPAVASFDFSGMAESLTGTAGDDVLDGGDGNDELSGLAGEDELDGGEGDDVLDGGIGNDVMTGGTGDDLYEVDDAGDQVIEDANEGTDRVLVSLAEYILDANVENLRGMSDEGQELTGNGLANVIVAGNGNDVVDGAAGKDVMYGKDGADTFYVDNSGDRVIEYRNNGFDRVFASASYSIAGQYVENLALAGTGDFNATGNGLDNKVTGNDGDNKLRGGEGDDVLEGGLGNDMLYGEKGNDSYFIEDLGDKAFEKGEQGHDSVTSSVSYSIAGQAIEDLTLTSTAERGTGNGLNNVLTGNDAANILRGGAGEDRLDGKGGADILEGGTGIDRFRISALPGDGEADTILDFSVADDAIELNGLVFGFEGELAEDAFVTGIAAKDAEDRIVLNQASGEIFFDADGNGSGAQVLIGIVDSGLALTHQDFLGYSPVI